MTEKEKTAPVVSVGADTEQSLNVCNDSITDFNEDGKSLDDYLEEMQKRIFATARSITFENDFYA